jgi:5'-nucleotidase (lipoprotein e(P4) family)
MKKLIIVACSIILASCGTVKQKSLLQEESQDQLILATLWYQRSAEMKALYLQCFRNAEIALSENLAWSDGNLQAAVVLDIDETVLDNSPFEGWQVIEGKPFNSSDWKRWIDHASAAPLPGAVEFTRYADSLGVEVFYVSNRTVAEMGPTIKNMAALGFAGADSTHMLLKETSSSKVARRAQLENDYEIILQVGDNLADFSGIYEDRGDDLGFAAVEADRELFGTQYIILPNPMYGNWLNELMKHAGKGTTREKLVRMLETF